LIEIRNFSSIDELVFAKSICDLGYGKDKFAYIILDDSFRLLALLSYAILSIVNFINVYQEIGKVKGFW
jgi:hypothetical protein